jgi:hypothetical protein
LQLLAALLITRQVVGNLKESLLPYAKKQLKLAKMSFDLFGALSPSSSSSNQSLLGTVEHHKKTDGDKDVGDGGNSDGNGGSDGAGNGDVGSEVGGREGVGMEQNGGSGQRTVSQVEVEGSTPKVKTTFLNRLHSRMQISRDLLKKNF